MANIELNDILTRLRCQVAWLLSLLLFHIIAALAAQQANSSPASSSFNPASNKSWKTNDLANSVLFVKTHMMVSRCSSRYVQLMPGRSINAKGFSWSVYAVLKVESDPSGGGYVRIKGDASKRYLCFSKKARLIARSVGKSDRCLFKEEYYNGFVKLRSAARPEWYVGFNGRGRKLYGFEHSTIRRRRRRRFRDCFMFTKTAVEKGRARRRRRHFHEGKRGALRRRSSRREQDR